MSLYRSPSHLPEDARSRIAAVLTAVLLDGLDLHSQIKVAHWNVRGPQFAALHPLFETFAVGLAVHTDAIAERAVTLGARVPGTARAVAKASRLAEYPSDIAKDLGHVEALADRFERFLTLVHEARAAVEKDADTDTADLLTAVIGEFEKHSWFLRATLG